MFDTLPNTPQDALDWSWEQFEPYFRDLTAREITEATVETWLKDWSRLMELTVEVEVILYTAKSANTADETAKKRFFAYLDTSEKIQGAMQPLREKLLASGIVPEGFDITIRGMKQDADLFREENLPLLTQLDKLGNEYDEIAGAQTIEWDGKTLTVSQAQAMLFERERDKREKVWRLAYGRQLEDAPKLNELWGTLLDLRLQVAANAGKDNFRDYMWEARHRADYTVEDNLRFLEAIREVAVPAHQRMLEQRRQALGVDALRPWDMAVDTTPNPPLAPFKSVDELIDGGARIFAQLDADLSGYYNDMRDNNLLDLDNRANKAPGGYCAPLPMTKKSVIFMNAVGIHDNVQTLLHEAGHAFHNYEAYALPNALQMDYPTEFAEVASMTMELMAAPYLSKDKGGFYSERDAARARIEHIESNIYFWCYMAIVDSFQHWVYENPADARNAENCNAKWSELWDTYLPGVDWSGLEAIKETGWQRKLHIFQIPFYYIEYGLAQLGASQVWRNSLQDYEKALSDYRYALSLGGTRNLPELFEAAGVKLAFDAETMQEIITLYEQTLDTLNDLV